MVIAASSYIVSLSSLLGCPKINKSKKTYLKAIPLGNVNRSYILTKLAERQIVTTNFSIIQSRYALLKQQKVLQVAPKFL